MAARGLALGVPGAFATQRAAAGAPRSRVACAAARRVAPLPSHRRAVVVAAAASPDASSSGSSSNGASASTSGGAAAAAAAAKYGWDLPPASGPLKADPRVQDIPVAAIRRPLGRTRANDQEKVAALMESIREVGLQEPIDVLLVDGAYYGFSGCHRFEAHQRLGLPTIRCRVRKASREILRMHMM